MQGSVPIKKQEEIIVFHDFIKTAEVLANTQENLPA